MHIGLWTVSTIYWISMHTFKSQITLKNSYDFSENSIEIYWVSTCGSYFTQYFIHSSMDQNELKKTYTGV